MFFTYGGASMPNSFTASCENSRFTPNSRDYKRLAAITFRYYAAIFKLLNRFAKPKPFE
jgi:hypothetical protein